MPSTSVLVWVVKGGIAQVKRGMQAICTATSVQIWSDTVESLLFQVLRGYETGSSTCFPHKFFSTLIFLSFRLFV